MARFRRGYLKELHFYVYECMEQMNLLGWEVRLTDDLPESRDANASIWITDNYRTAKLYLGEEWEARTAEEQRLSIAHELVHLVLHWMWVSVDHDLREESRSA